MFTKGKLQLIPDSPDIILYGSTREAQCVSVSGRIRLFSKPTTRQPHSLLVRFRPKDEHMLDLPVRAIRDPKISCGIVKDGVLGPTAMSLPYNYEIGCHEWRFTMGIPGSTRETIYTPAAYISYELVAELRMTTQRLPWFPLSFFKSSHSVPVSVKRMPLPDSTWNAMASEPMNISALWRDQLRLTCMAPSRVIHPCQLAEVSGVITPLCKGLQLLRAGFEIREYVSTPFIDILGADDPNLNNSRQVTTPAKCNSQDVVPNYPQFDNKDEPITIKTAYPPTVVIRRKRYSRPSIVIDQEIQVEGRLQVPREYMDIQYDNHSGPIKVSHELMFTAAVVDTMGQIHSVRLSSGIYVLPYIQHMHAELPRYEQAGNDILLAKSVSKESPRDVTAIFEHGLDLSGQYRTTAPPPDYYCSVICA